MVFYNFIVLTEVLLVQFSSSSLFICEKLVQVVYWKESDKLLVIGLPEEKWVSDIMNYFSLNFIWFPIMCPQIVLSPYQKKQEREGLQSTLFTTTTFYTCNPTFWWTLFTSFKDIVTISLLFPLRSNDTLFPLDICVC